MRVTETVSCGGTVSPRTAVVFLYQGSEDVSLYADWLRLVSDRCFAAHSPSASIGAVRDHQDQGDRSPLQQPDPEEVRRGHQEARGRADAGGDQQDRRGGGEPDAVPHPVVVRRGDGPANSVWRLGGRNTSEKQVHGLVIV